MANLKPDAPSSIAYAAAALHLACEERALRAIAAVEAGQFGAFLDNGEPVILYERHLFHRFTEGKFDGFPIPPGTAAAWGVLSAARPGGYGPVNAQHTKLSAAIHLDRQAALRATSWGLFQILGDNWKPAGYESLQDFVNAMYRSADDHLQALTRFLKADNRKLNALRSKDWLTFARAYNGPAQKGYDQRMRVAYDNLAPKP